jgi:predicted nuclease of predicted toxin-antitoxin system
LAPARKAAARPSGTDGHTNSTGLRSRFAGKPDREVWEFAKRENFAIVSADSDFCGLATTIGPPPKVVWLRSWIHPTRDAEQLLRREAVRITEFATDPELAVLVLDRNRL